MKKFNKTKYFFCLLFFILFSCPTNTPTTNEKQITNNDITIEDKTIDKDFNYDSFAFGTVASGITANFVLTNGTSSNGNFPSDKIKVGKTSGIITISKGLPIATYTFQIAITGTDSYQGVTFTTALLTLNVSSTKLTDNDIYNRPQLEEIKKDLQYGRFPFGDIKLDEEKTGQLSFSNTSANFQSDKIKINPTKEDNQWEIVVEENLPIGIYTFELEITGNGLYSGRIDLGKSYAIKIVPNNIQNISFSENVLFKTILKIQDKNYLFTGNYYGVSVFKVNDDGTLDSNPVDTNDDYYQAKQEIPQIFSLATAEMGGVNYLFAAGVKTSSISIYSIDDQAKLTYIETITDTDDGNNGNTYKLKSVKSITTAEIGSSTYLFAAAQGDNGVSVFKINNGGSLTHTDSKDALTTANKVATALVGSSTFLFVAGNSRKLNVFEVNDQGKLTFASVQDIYEQNYNYGFPMTTAKVGSVTYLFTLKSGNTTRVFTVNNDGTLTLKEDLQYGRQIYPGDTGINALGLFSSTSFNTVEINNTTYLLITGEGADTDIGNGVSLFKINDDGTFTHTASVGDKEDGYKGNTYKLEKANKTATTVINGKAYLLVSSMVGGDDGISIFQLNN